MKTFNFAALTMLTVASLFGGVRAQEITFLDIFKTADAGTVWPAGHFSDSRDDHGGAELINSGTYAFSVHSGMGLEDMSGGTTELIGPGTLGANSALAPIGFLFKFDGSFYTHFGVNGNGLLRLGQVTAGVQTLNSIATEDQTPKIMPFWDDLCVGTNGKVHYKKVGSGNSGKLVVEWQNMVITRGSGNCNVTGGGTFQMWLFDRTGVVQFVYGNGMTTATGNGGYSVGIQSYGASNFASVTTSNATVSYTAPNNVQIAPITAGTSYLFSPNIPAAVTGLNAAPVTQTSVQLNWTDNANNETDYLVRRTTDHVNFYFVGNLFPNVSTFTDTGLEPGTQYFYYVNALTEGAFSADVSISVTTAPAGNVASVTGGGLWSSPSTWAGGAVPKSGDNVTIASGATVIIDTAAVAGNVTVGSVGSLAEGKETVIEGGSPAVLRFGETAAFSLTVGNNVTIGANDAFTTGSGNANQHILNVRGDLVNNGTLDFSTNNNQAGATILFTGASNNSFSGTGATTDVMSIIVGKGLSRANILELSVSNFSVRGSTTDTPDSGYLILNQGTFKISGTFSGNHRTFPVANYEIPETAGLWLNNPNYTVAAQNSSVKIFGSLRVSAGTYNVGTALDQALFFQQGSTAVVEGGNINTAATILLSSTGQKPFSYTQTGGTVTTCTVGQTFITEGCFSPSVPSIGNTTVDITGGKIVIQNPAQTPSTLDFNFNISNPNVTVQFGNPFTTQPGLFDMQGTLPNVVLDTSAGSHALFTHGAQVRTMDIGPGGTFEIGISSVTVTGESFVNNGNVVVNGGNNSKLIFTGPDTVYSGSGTTGPIKRLDIRCSSFTIDPASSIRVRTLWLIKGNIINAKRLIIGNNDSTASLIGFGDILTSSVAGILDSEPVFELGTGGQNLFYASPAPRVMGPEVNPLRTIINLGIDRGSVTMMTGGDIVVITSMNLYGGEFVTGQYRILYYGSPDQGNPNFDAGFVNGTLMRGFSTTGNYSFHLGVGSRSTVLVGVTALKAFPSYLVITVVDTTLPGLLPATSVSKHWVIEEAGDVTAGVQLKYLDSDINGNEASYKLWQSTSGGPPVQIPGNFVPSGNIIVFGGTEFNGVYGIGEQLDPGPVSVSGRVTTSTGNPIRNAVVTISGGNLPAPVTAVTGSFGTYSFDGLQAGETYTLTASAKRYRFPVGGQPVTPLNNLDDVNFTANPQEEF